MLNLIHAELYNLRKNRNFWGVCLAMIFVFGGMFYLVATGWWWMDNANFASIGLEKYSATEMLRMSLFYNLFLSTLAAFFVNSDHATGVVKNQIVCGKSRNIIYITKTLVFTLASIFVAVVIPAVLSILITIAVGNGNIYTEQNIKFLMESYTLYALGIAAYSSFLMLVASATKESGKTILFTIIITIVMFIIEMQIVPYLPLAKKIYSYTIFSQGYIAFTLDKSMGQSIAVSVLSLTALIFWGCWRFKAEEIK